MDERERDSSSTRATFLENLKDHTDDVAWTRFFNTYWRVIHQTARRAGLRKEDADEIVQETILGVARKMPEFQYDPSKGSFKSWLLTLTRWRIRDFLRREKRRQTVTVEMSEIERLLGAAEFSELWDEEWAANLTEAASERLRDCISPEHYLVFDLTVLKAWNLRKAGQALRMSMPQLYLIRHRVRRKFQEEIEKLKEGI